MSKQKQKIKCGEIHRWVVTFTEEGYKPEEYTFYCDSFINAAKLAFIMRFFTENHFNENVFNARTLDSLLWMYDLNRDSVKIKEYIQ